MSEFQVVAGGRRPAAPDAQGRRGTREQVGEAEPPKVKAVGWSLATSGLPRRGDPLPPKAGSRNSGVCVNA